MTHYRQVNAVDLNHPRRSCGVDDPIRFDGPNAAPMQLAENLDNIGLSCFGADEPATAPAAAEIVAAKIQDNEPGSLRHRTIETRQHSAGCVPADPGIHDMGILASRVQHAPRIAGHASEGSTPFPWVLLAPRATICAAAGLAEAALKTMNSKTNRHFLIALTAFPLRLTLFHAHSQPSVQARLWPPCET
jgi:hypothetical protein